MDFGWTDEQLRLRRGAVEFASARLADGVRDRDRDGIFSRELWNACAELRAAGHPHGRPSAGVGEDLLSAVAILEGIGYGARDNGLVFSVVAHAASCEEPLATFGSEAQRREWLPGLADGSVIGATGITEPDSGSSALALATTAVQEGGEWVLNGSKTFVTNAPVADLFVVYARTGQGFGGIRASWSRARPPASPSARRSRRWVCARVPMAQVYLDDCRVPSASLVGRSARVR